MVKGKTKNALETGNHQHLRRRAGSNENMSTADSEDIPENMYKPEKYELDGWIHREKLAKIENEELQAAGINLAKARSRSRDALKTASRDRLRHDFANAEANTREEKRRKVSSPVPAQREEEQEGIEQESWDLRTPEEIEAEQSNSQSYVAPVLRKSGSRIPVLSPNTHSISPEPAEGTPLVQRKRTMSGNMPYDETSIKARTTSLNWNDENEDPTSVVTKKPISPTKVRQKSVSNSPASTSTQKSSVPRKISTTKPAAASSVGRPGTRGNDSERPKTAVNPPEGDPPWLADMYKPDPRLPPDQQIIPTLAKKQRQMEWEQNGMIPKTYDRDFTAMAVHEPDGNPAAQSVEPEIPIEKAQESESWPLKPLPDIRDSKEITTKPLTNSSPPATGGYSTMPKVSSPPMSISSPKIGSPPNTNVNVQSPKVSAVKKENGPQPMQQQPQPRPRLEDEDEKLEKKGCGCCIVM